MADTFTTSLSIRQIETGTRSGTWGTETNTQYELLDNAFSYVANDLASDADATLTISDGTASNARYFYIKFTSAVPLTATRTITLAPDDSSKIWIVENATTGSQALTFKQGSSGSTVTVSNGNTAMIYADGAGATNGAITNAFTDLQLAGTTSLTGLTVDGGTIKLDGNYPANSNNVVLGDTAFASVTTASNNTLIGNAAGTAITTSNFNTVVGSLAFDSQTTGGRTVAIGYSALGSDTTGGRTTAVGWGALANQNFTGGEISYNTAVGYDALAANTTGTFNTTLGYTAGSSITTGVNNTIIGALAGDALTTANSNTAVGQAALTASTTGANNVSIGYQTLFDNTSGFSNTAVGYRALANNTTADDNTAVGTDALILNTTGANNTCIGYGANQTTTTGSYNICIGHQSNPSAATTSEIMIGSATGRGNNTGYIYPPGGGAMYQATNLTTWAQVSDRRIKKNIVDNNDGLNKINAIRVRNFEYRTEEEITDFENTKAVLVKKEGLQLGVIAQEIQEILPDVVTEESTGSLTVTPDNITWYLVNAVKELSIKNDALEARIEALEG